LLSTGTVRLLLSGHILPVALLTIGRGIITLRAIGRGIIGLLSTLAGGLRVTRAGEGLLDTGCLWELLRVVLTCLRSRPRHQVRVPESLQQEEPEQPENGTVGNRGEETGEAAGDLVGVVHKDGDQADQYEQQSRSEEHTSELQ